MDEILKERPVTPPGVPRSMRWNDDLIGGLYDLIAWIGNTENLTLVEIGSWIGESTEIFAKSFGKVISVDPLDAHHKCAEYFHKRCDPIPNISQIRKQSVPASKLFEPQSIDVVYIDGNHSYQSVRSDILHWLPLIKDGGVICGHDYQLKHPQWPSFGVKIAVGEILGGPDKLFRDYSWAVRVHVQSSTNTILVM